MTPDELAKAQAEADGRMRAHWSVVDGVLVFDGKGESLCTASDYGDFELLVDWKIEKGGDSGLYLRGSPQVQIWDPAANPVGSGGLYNNQKGKSVPSEKADRPVGEWNSFRVVMIGERVSVYLNDRLVVDNVVLENYWERDKPIYPTGQIELQAHGNILHFRNIFLREIPRDTAAPPLAPAEADEGFAPLFNGRDLDGWTGDTEGYAAEDGKIVVRPELGSGNLYTVKEYADFVLRFEFKLTPAANNGLGIRAPLEGDAAYAGMELQILEDGSPVYWGLRPYQYHGSIYGVVPARRGFLRPPGEWNTEEVTVQGPAGHRRRQRGDGRRRRPRRRERRRHDRRERTSRAEADLGPHRLPRPRFAGRVPEHPAERAQVGRPAAPVLQSKTRWHDRGKWETGIMSPILRAGPAPGAGPR